MNTSHQPQETSTPRVSVIVPTLHRDAPLRTLLRYFLEEESYQPFELIVIDQSDQHDQETREFLSAVAHRMIYIQADYKSLPKARNHGVSLASGEVVVFVDDDAEPMRGFLAAHASTYVDPRVMGATGPVLAPGQSLLNQAAIGPRRYHALMSGVEKASNVDFSFLTPWASGGNVSFRRQLITQIGGFDENFYGVALGEDAEFSHRVKQTGGVIRYVPGAGIVHRPAGIGGCRDGMDQEQYLSMLVDNVNYFWWKIRQPFWVRYRQLWRLYRGHVLNRTVLQQQAGGRLTTCFARALWHSHNRIRNLARAAYPETRKVMQLPSS